MTVPSSEPTPTHALIQLKVNNGRELFDQTIHSQATTYHDLADGDRVVLWQPEPATGLGTNNS